VGRVDESYAAMLYEVVEKASEKEALVFPEERRTYGELLAAAERRVAQLRQLHVSAGDRFGILMPNSIELVEFLIGGALLGATVVPINTRFRPHELRHVIADAELVAVVTTDAFDDVVDFASQLYTTLSGLRDSPDPLAVKLDGFPHLRAVGRCGTGVADGLVTIDAFDGDDGEPAAGAPSDASVGMLIMYTSGTTADPKGCVISHRAMVLNSRAIGERLEIPETDRWWNPLPMFHMGGIMLMSSVFAAGGTFISQQHATADKALALIGRERPTVLYPLFQTISLDLIHHPDFDASRLRDVRLVGSVAPPDVQQRIQDALPSARVFSAFGITELCGCVAFNAPDDPPELRMRTCGRALQGFEMRVVDPDSGAMLSADERGELVGRGAQMFDGYYNNAAATAEVIDAEGFFHTGDICSMDPAGVITYYGRIKDMLKVGGENVSAIEVESFLATHPAIKMAQVIGVPDPRLQEVVAAFVEIVPGRQLSEAEVIAYCEGSIARFKIPRHVRFVAEWPMSATKVQKVRLREQMFEELNLA
jgi:fatty-acyl-CoA synthase